VKTRDLHVKIYSRIFSKPARPNHGLFGDGSIEKKRKIEQGR
jgi:hypothetical protein